MPSLPNTLFFGKVDLAAHPATMPRRVALIGEVGQHTVGLRAGEAVKPEPWFSLSRPVRPSRSFRSANHLDIFVARLLDISFVLFIYTPIVSGISTLAIFCVSLLLWLLVRFM